jgi:hypothetical protein
METNNRLAFVAWVPLVVGAALVGVPFLGLLSPALIPIGAAWLLFLHFRASTPSAPARRAGMAASMLATALLAGVAIATSIRGSWALVAMDRLADDPTVSSAELMPTAILGGGFVLAVVGLNLVGYGLAVLGASLRGVKGRVVPALLGLTPVGALGVLAVVSRVWPLTD